MFPISNDLVRALDDERRRTLRRHVRRRRRQPVDDAPPARRSQPVVWSDESGTAHVVDRDGVARFEVEPRRTASRRS